MVTELKAIMIVVKNFFIYFNLEVIKTNSCELNSLTRCKHRQKQRKSINFCEITVSQPKKHKQKA